MKSAEDVARPGLYSLFIGCSSTFLIYRLLRLNQKSKSSWNTSLVKQSIETPRKYPEQYSIIEAEVGIRTPSNADTLKFGNDIEEKVIIAARATAEAFSRESLDMTLIVRLFKSCENIFKSATVQESMNTILSERPDLITIRAAGMAGYIPDGGSLLHTAARWGNVAAIKSLLDYGGISAWDRDLQGKLPLHWAAAADNSAVEACQVLLAAMQVENGVGLKGCAAPVDLLGYTPLGWACLNKKNDSRPSQGLIDLLFDVGDNSVLPFTPYHGRSGSRYTPRSWRYSTDADTEEDGGFYGSTYAHSGAKGWRESMEDMIIAECPLVLQTSSQWSLFAVLDGHGGEFAATFAAERLPTIISEEMDNAINKESQPVIDISLLQSPSAMRNSESAPCPVAHEPVVTGGLLEQVLEKACMRLDSELSEHSRMRMEVKPRDSNAGATPFTLTCANRSGTTACICLVGPGLVAVGNLGDSRAVLGAEGPGRGKSVVAEDLSEDHLPDVPAERDRIEAAGYSIVESGNKFNIICPYSTDKEKPATLALSRSFGDFVFKWGYYDENTGVGTEVISRTDSKEPVLLPAESQAVSCLPDVVIRQRSKRDWFIIIACDGIWDVMSNDEAVEFVAVHMGYISEHDTNTEAGAAAVARRSDVSAGLYEAEADELQLAAAAAGDALLAECLKRGSTDNMSVLVALLKTPYYSFRSPPPKMGSAARNGDGVIYGRLTSFGSQQEAANMFDNSPLKPIDMQLSFDD